MKDGAAGALEPQRGVSLLGTVVQYRHDLHCLGKGWFAELLNPGDCGVADAIAVQVQALALVKNRSGRAFEARKDQVEYQQAGNSAVGTALSNREVLGQIDDVYRIP